MSFLTELPPKTLVVNGTEYPIDTDFRTILRYDEQLRRADETWEHIRICLGLVYDEIPEDTEKAALQLAWFVKCGKEEKRRKPSRRILGINSEESFDFEVDAELIYTAFRRNDVYGIDLHAIPYLHWWEFVAMLNDIPEKTMLHRVMDYRTIDTANKHLSKEQKEFYQAMQRYYRIRMEKDAQNEELVRALREGRDPSPYL